MIPQEKIDEVRQRSDIVAIIGNYVAVSKRGGDYWCCCPFHKEKTPSFKISAGHQAYHCFGCKKSGNVFSFVMELENVDFPDAVRLLARQTGVHIPEELPAAVPGQPPPSSDLGKDRLHQVLTATAEWFARQLATPEGERACQYLANRALDPDSIARFGLGYAPDSWDALLNWGLRQGFTQKQLLAAGLLAEKEGGETARVYDRFRGRLMFPIWDELGRVVGFSGRVLDKDAKTAKYVNSPETMVFHKGRLLYALHLARQSFKTAGAALVCEGQLDVIACHRAGITHAVAPQGTAFTEEQAKILRRHAEEVVFAFDADEAGRKAAVRSLEVALLADLRVRVVSMPEGEDPDGVFRQQGAAALRELLSNAEDAFDYLFASAAAGHDLGSPRGKDAVAQQIIEFINKLPQPVTRASLCQWLAGRLNLPEQSIFDALNRLRRQQRRTEAFRQHGRESQPGPPPATPVAFEIESSGHSAAVHAALLNLFDLAVHHQEIAQQLAQNEFLTPAQLGNGKLEQALLMVLQKTVDDEWDTAGRTVAATPHLATDPQVMQILNETHFPAPPAVGDQPPSGEQLRKWQLRLQTAMLDCLRAIDRHRLQQRQIELRAAIQNNDDPTRTATFMTDFQQLVRQKKHLAPGRPA